MIILIVRRYYVCWFLGMLSLYSCSEPDLHEVPVEPAPAGACAESLAHGYCDQVSYVNGEKVEAFLHFTSAGSDCSLSIYDINGSVAFTVRSPRTPQAAIPPDASEKGFGYQLTVAFDLPPDLVSGVYTIEKKIPFIVRPSASVDVLVVYPSNTVNAYALTGGKSLYSPDRPPAVSFHRPMVIQDFSKYCLNWFTTLPHITFGYIADRDLDDYTEMSRGRVIVLIGHNEYWTRIARQNFDRFTDNGGNALVLSGNTMWWQVRYSEHQMICYKRWDDPMEDPLLKTILWNDPRLHYPIIFSIGADFDLGGYGLRNDSGWDGYKIVSAESPLLEGTNLKRGEILSCPTTEYDGAPIRHWSEDGYPELDLEAMGAVEGELIGFDHGYRFRETTGTFIVFRKTETSGVIINTGSTDWCSPRGMGGTGGEKIRMITRNALVRLLNGQPVFSR
jgi:hypothetical protein